MVIKEQIINQRYRILDILSEGVSGITYKAEDTETGKTVALKALSLRESGNWKQIELFEREAEVLGKLNHPAIPQYLDYFTEEEWIRFQEFSAHQVSFLRIRRCTG